MRPPIAQRSPTITTIAPQRPHPVPIREKCRLGRTSRSHFRNRTTLNRPSCCTGLYVIERGAPSPSSSKEPTDARGSSDHCQSKIVNTCKAVEALQSDQKGKLVGAKRRGRSGRIIDFALTSPSEDLLPGRAILLLSARQLHEDHRDRWEVPTVPQRQPDEAARQFA
jgi:hypothetical protein